MEDRSGIKVKKGSVININQTVNGFNIFVVLELTPIDIRYGNNLARKYEYDQQDLLAKDKYTGETDFDVIGNIYDFLVNCK